MIYAYFFNSLTSDIRYNSSMLGSQRHFLISPNIFCLKATKKIKMSALLNSTGKESADLSKHEVQVELANLHLLYKSSQVVGPNSQLTFNCSNSRKEALKKGVKYIQI